jgi:hypothetical protein
MVGVRSYYFLLSMGKPRHRGGVGNQTRGRKLMNSRRAEGRGALQHSVSLLSLAFGT